MGLYLAVFDGEDELDGVEVGSYDDFHTFREVIVRNLENGKPGSRFPTLILHSDCDGEWSPSEALTLTKELETIRSGLSGLPPMSLDSSWKKEVAKAFGLKIENLCDCFFDVDGEALIERMIGLAKLSQSHNLPILFQ